MNNLSLADEKTKIQVRGLDFFYNGHRSLKSVDMTIPEKRVTALIGPSGCGKSTLLRIFNRIYALYPKQEASGQVLLDGENILAPKFPINRLRSKVGMVFQKPVPFPMTIYENVAYGIRHHEKLSKSEMDARVEEALRQARVVGRSEGQAQAERAGPVRWTAAASVHRPCRRPAPRRAAARRTHLCAGSDFHQPHRTAVDELKQTYTMVIVTHNMQQAARVLGLHRLHVPGRH
jgi:phosphate transport system ATP-binding protein